MLAITNAKWKGSVLELKATVPAEQAQSMSKGAITTATEIHLALDMDELGGFVVKAMCSKGRRTTGLRGAFVLKVVPR